MKIKGITIGLALMLGLASPAMGQDEQGHETALFVQQHANDFADDKISPAQIAHMAVIAYQAATASVCSDFSLDEKKFIKAFEKLEHEEADKLNDEQKQYHEKHLLIVYGIKIGSFLAEAAPDVAAFCAEAGKHRDDPEFAKETVWVAAN